MAYETDVFVNCPFDAEYLGLLRPIVFAIIDLGFTPRIALESFDFGRPRLEKIVALIKSSRYAIHDLSRSQAGAAGEYYRLNMPFELGLDVGCRLFGTRRWSDKKCLILEADHYRYRAALSDISGSDIQSHNNEPVRALTAVRDWLNNEAGLRAPGPTAIFGRFGFFMADNFNVLSARGFSPSDIDRLPVPELIDEMKRWVAANPG